MSENGLRKVGSRPYKISQMELAPELLEVQWMMPISDEDYAKLYTSISKIGVKDPLRGYFGENRKFLVLSGANRLEISTKLNFETLDIEVYEGGSRQEKIDFALGENLERRHLTNNQKRKIAEWKLRNSPEESDRVIAKKAGVDHKTVSTIRKRLESGGEIPHLEKRKGRDGKTQSSKKKQTEHQEFPLTTKQKQALIRALKNEIISLQTQIKSKQKEIDKLQKP
ncbi:chromosome partitioning protein ParB [Leptospira stimsonii]|uniref:Chromosome partitioning protein ParB n=1 Tax=Leptospira stimsonii TaxID=2202203 RepID=A0A396YPZ8_9LEPT|nr:chromosome partitioning protein ParB [Leptospira stimsonii]RHX84735.1 chromosome partitioning protein ParB [Leptospira stimsonii]